MDNKYPPFVGSSVDPNQLALTIKGGLMTLIPVAILIAASLKVTLDASDLASTVDTLFGIFTLGVTFYGLARKIFYAIKNR